MFPAGLRPLRRSLNDWAAAVAGSPTKDAPCTAHSRGVHLYHAVTYHASPWIQEPARRASPIVRTRSAGDGAKSRQSPIRTSLMKPAFKQAALGRMDTELRAFVLPDFTGGNTVDEASRIGNQDPTLDIADVEADRAFANCLRRRASPICRAKRLMTFMPGWSAGAPRRVNVGRSTSSSPRVRQRGASMDRLTGIRACVFDAYGTVFDLASAAARCSDIPETRRPALTTLWREKQLQYTWLRTLQGRYVDFWRVTGTRGLCPRQPRSQFAGRAATADGSLSHAGGVFRSPGSVARIACGRRVTAILSNGSPEMLDAAVEGAGLNDLFDAVLSVDAVRAFKTHPTVYQYALDRLGLSAPEVSFQSSNAWDAHAASDFGMRVVWCNRYSQRRERLPGLPELRDPHAL